MKKDWKYATILITGGTGTFGKAFLEEFIANLSAFCKLRILSRDEFKQSQLIQQYGDLPNISMLIGDVRDLERLKIAFHGVDLVVHAAALKHVPIGEYNPIEVVQTNIHGTQNVITACLEAGVKQAILLSSDKSVSPINLYGATKMVAEKLFVQANNYSSNSSGKLRTLFSVVRYGNVMGSRGSVLEVFKRAADSGSPLPITSSDMTRFALKIENAVSLVMDVALNKIQGGIVVPNLPAFSMDDLSAAFLEVAGLPGDYPATYIGIRPGEKMHERLMTRDEGFRAISSVNGNWFFIPPLIQNWQGDHFQYLLEDTSPEQTAQLIDYSSDTWPSRLDQPELGKLIRELFNV